MKLPRRNFLHLAAGAAALSGVSRVAWAQAYPTRPVRIIVGLAPGGQADIIARLIGQWLSERLGQPFVIDNRPGAATNIATEAVVRAPADGYTLLVVGPTQAINATLYDKLNFQFIRDIRATCLPPVRSAACCPTERTGLVRLSVSTWTAGRPATGFVQFTIIREFPWLLAGLLLVAVLIEVKRLQAPIAMMACAIFRFHIVNDVSILDEEELNLRHKNHAIAYAKRLANSAKNRGPKLSNPLNGGSTCTSTF
jgi:hypothetical protein